MAHAPKNPERSFGVSVGGALCAVAALMTWRGHAARAAAVGVIGVALVFFGLRYPGALARPSALWWRFSRAFGAFNARIILTVFFVVVLVPVSMIWRLIGTDPLARRRAQWPGWSPYPPRYRDPKHYLRMY